MEEKIKNLPIIPLKGTVLFPESVINYNVNTESMILALNDAVHEDQLIFMSAAREISSDEPSHEDIFTVGVVANIQHISKTSENNYQLIAKGLYRARLTEITFDQEYAKGNVEPCEIVSAPSSARIKAHMRAVKDAFFENVNLSQNYKNLEENIFLFVRNVSHAGVLCDIVADNVLADYKQKQKVLAALNETKRLDLVLKLLNDENSILTLENTINNKVKESIDENQKEYYLREKLRVIKDEIGDNADGDRFEEDIREYYKKLSELSLPEENNEKMLKEIKKLETMPPYSQENAMARAYIDTCLSLPWNFSTEDNLDIVKIREKLDSDHYGLSKVKDRLIEAFAVKQLVTEKANQTILCLVGPPGVGKTSIAKSIAEALGKNYSRVALGGVHDESEIRGHRRTYIGSMMGRIMYAVSQAKSNNPLILLDEIDKLGKDMRGDPTSALLEVLDSEQNFSFFDHYIDMPFDLSKVLFITTANSLYDIPEPLRDRMDIIELGSYTSDEKFNIAKKHLIKKQLSRNGLTSAMFKITDSALTDLIESYTREAGVRSLERYIALLMRKAAVKIISGEEKSVKITVKNIEEYLGARKFTRDTLNKKDEIGLATGLAWTSVGGTTLPVEVAIMDGSGKLELTGSLGDVMKESAHAAFTCIRSRANILNIESDFYKKYDFHIHVPEGAVPKDGPSAGITIATALASALTNRPVRRDVAMTGEITLRGRVLPIGGLREKSMAAYNLGVKEIIIPKENVPNLEEVETVVKENVKFTSADSIEDVLASALVQGKKQKKSDKKSEKHTEVISAV